MMHLPRDLDTLEIERRARALRAETFRKMVTALFRRRRAMPVGLAARA